jgi:hypothetical protein
MTSTMTRFLALPFLAAVLLLAACNEDGEAEPSGTPEGSPGATACTEKVVSQPIEGEVLPLVVSSDLAVGENRFVLGLIDQTTDQPLTDATIHLEFVCFDTPEGSPAFESDMEAITLTKTYTHTHDDGLVEAHEAGQTGAYVSYVDFDRFGIWGIDVTGTTADGRKFGPLRSTFGVNQTPVGLAPGDPAPPSEQPIAADESGLHDLDTSVSPSLTQHNLTIADAIASGKPTVVAFSTPAFCQSQICGPIKEIFDDLNVAYEGRANFVHIEPYDVPKMRNGDCPSLENCLVPTLTEWRLPSEPWVFVVGADGLIDAKFDGIASYEEIDAALKASLDG